MNGYRKLDLHRWYDHTGTTILSRCSILTPLHSFDSLSSLFCIPFISAQGKRKSKGGTDDDAEARADGDADTIETTEEKGNSKSKGDIDDDEEELEELVVEDGVEGEGKVRNFISHLCMDIAHYTYIRGTREYVTSILNVSLSSLCCIPFVSG